MGIDHHFQMSSAQVEAASAAKEERPPAAPPAELHTAALGKLKKEPMTVSTFRLSMALKMHHGSVTRWCTDGRFPNAFRVNGYWRIPVTETLPYPERRFDPEYTVGDACQITYCHGCGNSLENYLEGELCELCAILAAEAEMIKSLAPLAAGTMISRTCAECHRLVKVPYHPDLEGYLLICDICSPDPVPAGAEYRLGICFMCGKKADPDGCICDHCDSIFSGATGTAPDECPRCEAHFNPEGDKKVCDKCKAYIKDVDQMLRTLEPDRWILPCVDCGKAITVTEDYYDHPNLQCISCGRDDNSDESPPAESTRPCQECDSPIPVTRSNWDANVCSHECYLAAMGLNGDEHLCKCGKPSADAFCNDCMYDEVHPPSNGGGAAPPRPVYWSRAKGHSQQMFGDIHQALVAKCLVDIAFACDHQGPKWKRCAIRALVQESDTYRVYYEDQKKRRRCWSRAIQFVRPIPMVEHPVMST